METFTEHKNIKAMESKLPRDYTWHWTAANRDHPGGRPWGGLVIGLKNNVIGNNFWHDRKKCVCGIDVLIEGTEYSLTGVYCREGVSNISDLIYSHLEDNKAKKCIVVGDWNARIGLLGGGRSSKDHVDNSEGADLLDLINDFNLNILNGCTEGDWEGEFTHTDYRSQSVIDYVAANDEACLDIDTFKIGSQMRSDHFPLETTLRKHYVEPHITPKSRQRYTPTDIEMYTERLLNYATI